MSEVFIRRMGKHSQCGVAWHFIRILYSLNFPPVPSSWAIARWDCLIQYYGDLENCGKFRPPDSFILSCTEMILICTFKKATRKKTRFFGLWLAHARSKPFEMAKNLGSKPTNRNIGPDEVHTPSSLLKEWFLIGWKFLGGLGWSRHSVIRLIGQFAFTSDMFL